MDRLYRSRTDRVLLGVCGGLAKYLNIDPVIVRVIAVLLFFSGGLGLLAYIILAIVVPLEASEKKRTEDIIEENAEDIRHTAEKFGKDISRAFSDDKAEGSEANRQFNRRRTVLALVLIGFGVLILVTSVGIWRWLNPGVAASLALIAVGLVIILGVRRK